MNILKEIRKCPIHGDTEFAFYSKSSHNGQWKCLKCDSETSTLNKQMYKLRCVEYKGGKCEVCGYDKNIAALEFHHLNPEEKEFTICKKHKNFEDAKKELDKCILVCCNCHREIHNEQSTKANIYKLYENHKSNLELKVTSKKKFDLSKKDISDKYAELKNWKLVAEYFNVSISTIKRYR